MSMASEGTRRRTWSTVRPLLLLLPAYALLIGVFAYPVLDSMWRSVTEPTVGLGNYTWALGSSGNLAVIGRTFGNALLATMVCVVLGFPFAYLMVISAPRTRAILIAITLVPFWTSLMIRTFAWIVILQDRGIVNSLLGGIGLGPLELLRTNTGVLIGLAHVLMPFMILPLYATMNSIDLRLVMAARSLGASPFSAFWRIFVPLSVPGLAAGSLLVFIQALGFYITPALLGSPADSMLAQSIYSQVNGLLAWGRGGALGVILLTVTLVLLGAVALLIRTGHRRNVSVGIPGQ